MRFTFIKMYTIQYMYLIVHVPIELNYISIIYIYYIIHT